LVEHSSPRSESGKNAGVDLAFARSSVFSAEECKALTVWAEAEGIADPASADETTGWLTAERDKQPPGRVRRPRAAIYDETFGERKIAKRYKELYLPPGTRHGVIIGFHRRLRQFMSTLNERVWRFRLTRFSGMFIIRYEAGHEVGLHMDLSHEFPDRKLMAIVQLSAADSYEGGVLGFGVPLVAAPREQGSLLVFPAWVPHQVTPVTSGIRYSLVCGALGPSFR